MRRKKSNNRNGRLANTKEKRYQGWLKEQPCVWCGNEGPSIVDHCRGQTFGHNKVHVGHAFCVSACTVCDTQKTIHGKRLGNEAKTWAKQINKFEVELMVASFFPDEVCLAIESWGR